MSPEQSPADSLLTRLGNDSRTWPVLMAAVLVAEALMLLESGRNQWFFFDEWRLVVERVIPEPDGAAGWFQQLFRPDGEHVIGVPLALFVVLTRWFGIDNYWPFIVANVVIRVATLVVADDIARRLGARRAARLWALVTIAFFGGGFESLFGQSLIFAGLTLLFCLLAIRVAVSQERTEWSSGAWSATFLVLAIFSSSYGFPVVVGVALVYGLRHWWRAAVLSLVVPPVAFVLVRALAGGSYGQQQPFSIDRVPLYVDYVQIGLGAVGEAITGLDGTGFASFVLIVVGLALISRTAGAGHLAAASVASVVLFYAQASLSRSVFGADQASATRYVFFCGVLIVVAMAAAWGRRRLEGRAVVVAAVLVFVSLVNGIGLLIDGRGMYLAYMTESRGRLPIGLAAVEQGLTGVRPDPEHAPDLYEERLAAVIAWEGSAELLKEGRACFEARTAELDGAGVDLESLSPRQVGALVLLLNEHALGVGANNLTIGELLVLGAQGGSGSPVIDELQSEFEYLVQVIPPIESVPSLERCAR